MSSEKADSFAFAGTPDIAEVESFEIDWTPQEEAAAKRKLDFIIMPLLMLGFFCLQLDRGNIGNAITDTFFKDVGIVQNQFNIGQQLLSLGIVLFELPSNMLLYRVGPGKWLSSQVVAFGLVSTFQAFQSSYGAFLATRLLLGLTESGYIPGALYTLSTWYTRKETAKRVMVFFIGNLSASATSNLLAYGLLQMRGVGGKPGWFWLFTIMGLFTILSGFVLAFLLPDSFQRPTSFLLPKRSLFTERELHILRYRVWKDDPIKSQKKKHISGQALKSALSYWPLYIHVLITMTNNGPLSALGSYTPTIINSFGFERLRSNALASVGLWIQIPIAVTLSYISDHFNWRAATTIFALSLNLLFQVLLRAFTDSNNRNQKYGIMVLVQIMMFVPHPLNVAWMSLKARNSEERAVAMAMIIMAANAAGIYAAQLFRSDDKPRYHRALTIDIAILILSLISAISLALYYRYKTRKEAQEEDTRAINSSASSDDGKYTPPLSAA